LTFAVFSWVVPGCGTDKPDRRVDGLILALCGRIVVISGKESTKNPSPQLAFEEI
jgi:hypothetical protein